MQPYPSIAQSARPTEAAVLRAERLKAFFRPLAVTGKISPPLISYRQQYAAAFTTFAAVTLFGFLLQNWIGYQAIALVYLLSVVLLALFVSRGPIYFGTVLTAAGWNFFFAPPAFAFNISDTYDNMMLITYFVVTLTVGQLTTRLRAQRDAEMQAKVLAESERLGRTLLNSVSHELRTPIAAITSAANSLRSASVLTLEQQNLTDEIESASVRLNRIVQSLLSAARIQAGHVHPRLDWCDVSDLVRVALRGAENLIARHPVQTRIEPGLPLVRMDFVLMEQALGNLLVNAATHTPPATPVEITARIEGRILVLEVADRGPGLPPDQLERVFEPFHRAPLVPTEGAGLGLAIVKGFVEAQGGQVKAANRERGGAVFCISMPASDKPDLPDNIL